jgi:hypothetical protein
MNTFLRNTGVSLLLPTVTHGYDTPNEEYKLQVLNS